MNINEMDDSALIAELYRRKVSVETIFGRYYEIEVAADGRQMTVADAELVADKQMRLF